MNYPTSMDLCVLAGVASIQIREGFGRVRTNFKPDGSVVTEVDLDIGQMVINAITRDFPHISVVGEEESHWVEGSEYTVYVDPVDGTLPFTMGMPIASFCISVVHNGRPISAVISDPFQRRIWQADHTLGASLRSQPITVSKQETLKGAKIGYVCWPNAPFHMHDVVGELQNRGALCMNPLTIAYLGGMVASGYLDAVVFPASHVWETAAMDLLVTEAGGQATDLFGKPLFYDGTQTATVNGHIISNGQFHEEIVDVVRGCQ